MINKLNDIQEQKGRLFKEEVKSDEVSEIISAVPRWIVRWGITIIFAVLGGIIIASALIKSPDIVKTTLKVTSLNAPKIILSHQNGKLVTLLVNDGDLVKKDQVLGYLESIADPKDVLTLANKLKDLQHEILRDGLKHLQQLPENFNLGELQAGYQAFYQQFMQYQATRENGYYLSKKAMLQKGFNEIKEMKAQILDQQQIQLQEFKNATTEYNAYKNLYQKNVISRSEFVIQENKYLSYKYPLQQTKVSLINNSQTYNERLKDLLDLERTISEEKSNFIQSLNQFVTEINSWIQQYVLKTPIEGKLSFAGIIQQNQNLVNNQEVFIVNPSSASFFGEIQIPQYNMGKVKQGQKTLIKLHGYPFEQFGILYGRLTYISDVAHKDSVFLAKVSFERFENKEKNKKIILKNGMRASAEIITEESSLLERFFRDFTKIFND
jgi:multidrug efflux pump subunit AcrA (membrane-fusion protein)